MYEHPPDRADSAVVLVTRGGAALEDDATYQIPFAANRYAEEAGRAYSVQVVADKNENFLRTSVHD